MIINFYNVGGGGGGGTTNYNQLENKPQINGVTLSGNVSSDQLGITPNELKAVENVPSAATNGSVFAEYREEEVGHYGWQYDSATGSTFIFDMTLNPFEIIQSSSVFICVFTYDGFSRRVDLMNEYTSDNRIIMPGVEEWQPGSSSTVEPFTGVYLNFDYTDIEHPSFTFVDGNGDPVDVVISDEVTPYSETLIIKELKQVYTENGVLKYDTLLKKENLVKWYNYVDGAFLYARENCTNDGDYLVHQGAEIEGSRTYAGVTVSNGVITNAGYGGVNNLGDGHWAGNKTDSNGVTYYFHCWIEGDYLYWQTSSPIMDLDAYGTGSDRQGGILLV